MKKLFPRTGVRNRLGARPVSDVAPAAERLGPAAAASAIPQWRELRLHALGRACRAPVAITVALLCEPSGLIGWLKALAAGAIVPWRPYRHCPGRNRAMEG